jgi:hypothetical protein
MSPTRLLQSHVCCVATVACVRRVSDLGLLSHSLTDGMYV